MASAHALRISVAAIASAGLIAGCAPLTGGHGTSSQENRRTDEGVTTRKQSDALRQLTEPRGAAATTPTRPAAQATVVQPRSTPVGTTESTETAPIEDAPAPAPAQLDRSETVDPIAEASSQTTADSPPEVNPQGQVTADQGDEPEDATPAPAPTSTVSPTQAATSTQTPAPSQPAAPESTQSATPTETVTETPSPAPGATSTPRVSQSSATASPTSTPTSSASASSTSPAKPELATKELHPATTPPKRDTDKTSITSQDTVWVTDYLNVRSGPSASLPKLTILKPGQSVQQTGRSANNYQQIVVEGRTGWAQATYLTAERPAEGAVPKESSEASRTSSSSTGNPSSDGTPSAAASIPSADSTPAVQGAYLTVNVNLRTAAGVDQTSLGVLPANSRLMVRGPEVDGWTPVVAVGTSGWVKSEFLSTTRPRTVVVARLTPPVKSTPPSQNATVKATTTKTANAPETEPGDSSQSDSSGDGAGQTVYAAVNVNVRSGAGTGYRRVGGLVQGAAVGTRGASVNGWTPVSLQGTSGWVKSSLLSATKPKVTAQETSSSSGTVVSSTPRSYSAVPNNGGVDPWGFYWGQCVSYVAWQVRSNTSYSDFENVYNGVHFGNASNWASAARSLGITVNNTPTVGSVAWRSSGSAGHVAYVTAVHANGTIDVSEYNFLVSEGYDTRSYVNWNSGGSSGFDGFIHF